ncbi:sucrose phosphorylase [Desulfatibacillum alkenivorans DSM 16219]|jgi:sucrose phosphorylase|uniref:Sucrose phosphorylase n=1 Tax=Desulfatibacillum alkenivorans DSM 16219 TaxID=1121393 RepID=A0A1M6XB00_9BACT|nr:sugar phosphorylase [Desulfatibacillum alkenivorans]SHL03126.1 sucrose phosphorylase [Desulfatibacillum alkenivorans DSM 16219]
MARARRKGRQRFHLLEPDYERPLHKISEETAQGILEKLTILYGEEEARIYQSEVLRLMKVYYAHKSPEMIEFEQDFDAHNRFTEEDVILITYGDLLHDDRMSPLDTLTYFCERHLRGTINTLHLLPFFPYSSDRGFAVIDFEEVDPRLGTWEDIDQLKSDFRLMFDGVFNHVSSKSKWFAEFRDGAPDFQDFFIVFSTSEAISKEHLKIITRPRPTPILSEFSTYNGYKWVWTTFSPDQIDLNFKNPRVLLKTIQILLYYIRRGSDVLRLDAVTYLWHELGTHCVHLKETHAIIQLFRLIIDAVAPVAALITETNVPHDQNVTYFGDGSNEAHMIYNFALPPMVLHAFQNGDATALTKWASSLGQVSKTATYFNFLDSHDGVGVTPVKEILTSKEIELMAWRVIEHGGFISYKDDGDGNLSPYEMNITWWSAINREDADEDDDFQVKRFCASRSIALALMGVPGIYFHGLLGSKNDAEAVIAEKHTRSINRMVLDYSSLKEGLNNPESTTYKVVNQYGRMIAKRVKETAFHPNAPQDVLNLHPSVFCVKRTCQEAGQPLLALTNVSGDQIVVEIPCNTTGIHCNRFVEILSGDRRTFVTDKGFNLQLTMEPYDVFWLTPAK